MNKIQTRRFVFIRPPPHPKFFFICIYCFRNIEDNIMFQVPEEYSLSHKRFEFKTLQFSYSLNVLLTFKSKILISLLFMSGNSQILTLRSTNVMQLDTFISNLLISGYLFNHRSLLSNKNKNPDDSSRNFINQEGKLQTINTLSHS